MVNQRADKDQQLSPNKDKNCNMAVKQFGMMYEIEESRNNYKKFLQREKREKEVCWGVMNQERKRTFCSF